MSANFATKKLNQISELWQHVAFGEDRFNELDIYNLSSKINCHFSDEWLFRPKEEAKLSAICIMPFEFDISSFLGINISSNSSICHDQSLFCRLSKKENLMALQRIQKDYFNSVPQIHFTYKTLSVTIMAILVPNLGQEVPNGPLDDQKIKTIAQKFGDGIEKLIRADHLFDEGQFRSSQKVNDQTMEQLANSIVHAVPKEAAKIMHQWLMFDQLKDLLLKDRQKAMNLRESVKTHLAMLKAFANFSTHAKIHWFLLDKLDTTQKDAASTVLKRNYNNHNNLFINFAFLLAYLEQWSKSNHINGEHIGFLNFNILVVMVTKIVLAHSNAALPILIEKFFITYSTWPWPLPVQLTEISVHRKGEFLSWMPGREWFTKRQHSPKKMLKAIHAELAMAIITPTFPERNLAQNSNISAFKCIQNQMNKALKALRNESDKNALIGPLINKKFSQMYEHFIVVICAAPNYQIETFANFVGVRIGHELPEIIENPLEKWIKFCHLFVHPISLGECNNNNNAPSPKSSSTYCKKIWLVGIELNEKQKELSKFQDKLREKLKKKLAEKIISNFEGSFVEIETDYVNEREQLQKLWGIDLNLI
ncbi:hypothetical protein niasHS_015285 [Heterodera schachtii]|uniref:polynucleotide adenylyltransferase n=2 Tax=Heterodera TaxID=34509 RepID=A0ABD2IA95_HETSC